MHEYKKETLRDDCLLRVVTGIEIINTRNNKAPTFVEALSYGIMVPVGGLEPPRPKATDFESVVYTNFTTPASLGSCPLMTGIIRKQSIRASAKD